MGPADQMYHEEHMDPADQVYHEEDMGETVLFGRVERLS